MLQHIVIKEISSYLKCDPASISMDTRLDDLGIDSLGAITILYELEDKLEVVVPTEVFETLNTVGDILTQLENITASKNIK